jgi:hypothetical protein
MSATVAGAWRRRHRLLAGCRQIYRVAQLPAIRRAVAARDPAQRSVREALRAHSCRLTRPWAQELASSSCGAAAAAVAFAFDLIELNGDDMKA